MAKRPATDPKDIPEPDRLDGAPHPRDTAQLFGQQQAQDSFLAAFNSSRLHHAWLLTGPKGIGKATLAWRIARFLLSAPETADALFAPPEPKSLDLPHDHPIHRRLAQMSDPRLFLLRRAFDDKKERLSEVISVDELRRMKSFFSLSAADGGRRVAIIDCLDDFNTSASNALLKLLEEPPKQTVFLLIAHQPARLLPTIRSRCRELRLLPLAGQDMAHALAGTGADLAPDEAPALSELAQGSVGEAFRLSMNDGLQTYQAIIEVMSGLPAMDRMKAIALADRANARGTDRFDLIVTLMDVFLARLARAGVTRILPPDAARGEGDLIARLCQTEASARAWANLAQHLGTKARQGKSVNLDPSSLLMDMLLKIDETAADLMRRP